MTVSALPTFLRPKVVVQTFDLTEIVATADGTLAFVNGEFHRGSLTPTYISGGTSKFYDLYGSEADPSLSYAHDTCTSFLPSEGVLLINRVVNTDATHAAMFAILDDDATYGKRMLMVPHATGFQGDYTVGDSGVYLLKVVGGDIVSGKTLYAEITDGTTVTQVSTNFTSSHAATMAAFVDSLTTAIAGFGIGGYAQLYTETSSVTASAYTIVIVPPTNATIIIQNSSVKTGVSPDPSKLVTKTPANCWFGTFYAENPGDWANDVGVKIADFDVGTKERYTLTFSGSLVASNSIAISVLNNYTNATETITVPFATNSDTTMQAIATALAATNSIHSATVVTIDGAVDNDRQIIVEAAYPMSEALTWVTKTITGGTSQAVISVSTSLAGDASDGTFSVYVYNRESVTTLLENWKITTFPFKDRTGTQIQYKLINEGPKESFNIRFNANPTLTTSSGFAAFKDRMLDSSFVFRNTLAYLGGGYDGSAVTTGQLRSALAPFKDVNTYAINLVLSAGYTAVPYMQDLVALCESRGDATAILDMPSDYQLPADAVSFRKTILNIDNSYGALYSPDIKISDISTDEIRYIPPSGMVAGAYVYNDKVGAKWSSPAGFNRGKLKQALGFRVNYSPDDEELMNPAQINCLVTRPSIGAVIMGDETLQSKKSALSQVPIRRLVNMLNSKLSRALEYTEFEPHTESTRYNVRQLAESILSPVYRNDGLYGYMVKCDDDNNTSDVIDADALICDVYIKPVRRIKGILLRSIITRTGTSFELITGQF